MKTIRLSVLLIATLAAAGTATRPPQGSLPCWNTANTQGELNDCARQEFQDSDKDMNRVYQQVLAKYKSDRVFIDRLKTAQKAWLAYRDSHLESWYPDIQNPNRFYGSVRPMCMGLILAGLTEERTKLLKQMLEQEEGDVCALPIIPGEPAPPPFRP